jgi:hypothetical protein
MIALVPLDDRPCNVRFPQQIAAIGSDLLVVPDQEFLGRFNTPGEPRQLVRWLDSLPEVSALIVSIDMLAYGGLVASRKPRVSTAYALERLQSLRVFREQRPDVPIYAFNILMRLAVTMDSDAAVANYYNIMRYARLADEAERFDSDHLRDELNKVRAQIPDDVLDEYLRARARNHEVNTRMIEWLSEDVFDYLLITQEDATEFGLHRQEQERLLARVRELNVEGRMSLHPGADEAALTLLARHWNTNVRFRVHTSSDDDMKRIAPFEDRPYAQSLTQHVASMRGALVEENPDFELFINAPVGGSQKDESAESRAGRLQCLQPFINELIEYSTGEKSGAHIALCDVAFPNGADNALMTALDAHDVFGHLSALSGWNTAGNTTGTLLAQCAAIKRSGGAQTELNRQFVFERLVDDWYYQAQVRTRIERAAREQGLVPHNMGEAGAPVEAQARRELKGFAQLLAKRHFGSVMKNSEITLPWRRAFEADVRVELV